MYVYVYLLVHELLDAHNMRRERARDAGTCWTRADVIGRGVRFSFVADKRPLVPASHTVKYRHKLKVGINKHLHVLCTFTIYIMVYVYVHLDCDVSKTTG